MNTFFFGDNNISAETHPHEPSTFALLDDGCQCRVLSSFSDAHSEAAFGSRGSKSESMEKSACKQKCKEAYKSGKKQCKTAFKDCKRPVKAEKKNCKRGCKQSGVDELTLFTVMSLRDPRALGSLFL